MKKTVVSHFYNEEHLLPWWLRQHKQIFDHGIMIDYASNDRSVEIIREICPTWEIRPSVNTNFSDSTAIDNEVMDIERGLDGWRMCLNTTEFLYGNINHLDDRTESTQYFIGNYVFVDMEDETKGPLTLSHDIPLHEQRYWGYDDFANTGSPRGGIMSRMNRSLHNYPVTYKGGRHWGGVDYPKSFDDLVIFYYGWADVSDLGLKRKTQISTEKGGGGPHAHNKEQFLDFCRTAHRSISRNLKDIVEGIYSAQQRSIENRQLVEDQHDIEQPIKEIAAIRLGSTSDILATESKLIQAEPRIIG
jgi:hypothetical protein